MKEYNESRSTKTSAMAVPGCDLRLGKFPVCTEARIGLEDLAVPRRAGIARGGELGVELGGELRLHNGKGRVGRQVLQAIGVGVECN